MELFRRAAASTYVTFPMVTTAGESKSGLTLTGTWLAWDSTGGAASGNTAFQNLSGAFPELDATGVYGGFLASTELPAASPFVMLRFTGTGAATQYLLVRTASVSADVTGINGTNIAAPVTAGYMPVDVKQTISLTAPQDNSIEKSLSRTYFATVYVDAAISTRSAPATAQTVGAVSAGAITSASFAAGAIDAAAIAADAIGASELAADAVQSIVDGVMDSDIFDFSTDNSVAKTFQRLYHATDYLVASVLSGSRYADDFLGRTLTRGASGGRTVGQALMAQRNRVAISAGTLTVYSTDDTTAEWTATIATEAVSAIVTDINPA